MKKIILSALLLLSFNTAQAGGCLLEQAGDVNVTWKAYKTLSKLGVQGVFTDVKYTPNKKSAANFKELFIGSKISIDVSKIDTKHKARDKTLVAMFFNQLKGGKIEGEIKSIEADKSKNGKRSYTGVLEVSLKMNGRTLLIPMKYQYKKGDFQAIGTIDIFDFDGNDALRSINKSCFDLHKGKTWSDVNIGFRTKIKATLCDTKICDCKKDDCKKCKNSDNDKVKCMVAVCDTNRTDSNVTKFKVEEKK
ncbi:MAG: YceI family protein [Sulfurovaceae bacterium]|nr:YceI family protein [Sulfurovaceae bacterium]